MGDLILTNGNNTIIQSDITKDNDKDILNEGKVLTSYETVINRLVEQYYDNPSSVLTMKNCLTFGKNNMSNDVYTKEEIREILTNYYTKEEIFNLFVNKNCTTGEMFDFYLDGLNITEIKPISTKQISFNISNNNSESKTFSIEILNPTILHNGALFNL